MPLSHESPEWQDVQKRLRSVEDDVISIKKDVETITERQAEQHLQNSARITELTVAIKGDGSELNPGIDKKLDRIYTVAKISAWLIGPGAVGTFIIMLIRTASGH